MSDPEHADSFCFILDGADDAVITDSIPPQPDLLATQRLAESVRIVLARDSFSQKREDSSLNLIVEAR